MAAKKVKVTYQDGREEVVKVLPRAQVMTEQYFSGFKSENGVALTYHLGWAALVVLKKETLDYETWLDRVEDVEDYEDPEQPEEAIEEIPPTPPVHSGDVSSD
jgi:hypothetical protein